MYKGTPILATVLGTSVMLALGSGCDREPDLAEADKVPVQEAHEAQKPEIVSPTKTDPAKAVDVDKTAKAQLKAAEGSQIAGTVDFMATGAGVRVTANITHASPGKHGFHIHEKGDCSDIVGKSMGGHFAPRGHQHALPSEQAERHLGDLGNIVVGEDGSGELATTVEDANLKQGDSRSFLGKAVVIHAGEDQGKAKQPAGDSGTPIACGVIGDGGPAE